MLMAICKDLRACTPVVEAPKAVGQLGLCLIERQQASLRAD